MAATTLGQRIVNLQKLFDRIEPVPQEWLMGMSTRSPAHNEGGMELAYCNRYSQLVEVWCKAMQWTKGLDHALTVMLASITSTKSVGSQLWVKVIGPASCGKSTLCEAVSVNKTYVLAKSTIRGFHSGYKMDADGDEDVSLVSQLMGKTLVTKDGDTLLQSPNLGQILAEARDIYDSTSRTHYRHGLTRDYEGVRMTWLLCGTSSLRSIDSSELGERFLDCVIMDGIDDELEDEILYRVAKRSKNHLAIASDGAAETHQAPEMTEAMRLTGGYVQYLRENAQALLAAVKLHDPEVRMCTRLGKLVAYMRARPSLKQKEVAEREFAARLVEQHVRLATCLAVVFNKDVVDEEIMQRTRQVCLDTARGQTFMMTKHLYDASQAGLEVGYLSNLCNMKEVEGYDMLRFLRRISVVEPFKPVLAQGVKGGRARWRLTPRLHKLWHEVVGD